MTWDELKEAVKDHPNIRIIYKGTDRISVDFITDEGLKPKPPEPLPDGTEYYFEAGM